MKRDAIPCPRVCQLTVQGVENSSQKYTVLKADIDEHRRLGLVDTGIEHLSNADGRRKGGQSLKTDSFQRRICVEGKNSDGLILTSNSLDSKNQSSSNHLGTSERKTNQEWCALTIFWDLCNTQGKHGAAHGFPILILIQLSIQVKLKVDQLGRAQSHNDLPLVRSRTDNGLTLRDPPLVHAAVRENVSDTVRMDL